MAGHWETPETWRNTWQDPCLVSRTCWLLLFPFWHDANYIVIKTSHFFSLWSSSPIPHPQIRDAHEPQPDGSGSKSSGLVGATSSTSLTGTQQECRHLFVHSDGANAVTKQMTQDANLKMVCKTGCSKSKKQHGVGCEYIHIEVSSHQITIYHTADVCRELHDQCIAVHNGKPRLLTKTFLCTVCEI